MTIDEAYKKASELVSKMTAEEKMSQLVYNSPAIERLGINEYNWWNEALHGVARAGTATVFPQAIGLAATFNPELVFSVADVISTEGRAKYNKSIEYGDRDIYKGLTYWSPNINIFRDPRWGRGQETYGEDPYLTSEIAKQFIKGVQGDGEYLKACACAKHFAAHSGPEEGRRSFNSEVSKKDLYETYFPAFEKCVENGVAGVMGSYNAINGIPACANTDLIEGVIRQNWGFKGYFVSDCGAIGNIWKYHEYAEDAKTASAVSLNAGCDLNCGDCYLSLVDAYEEDLVSDETITKACERLFAIRYRLGEFEEKRPYSDIGFEKVDCKAFRDINLKTAKESIVLLKNDGILPLDKSKVGSIAVVGPNAMSVTALEGNYEGKASEYITIADGIRREFSNSEIRYSLGSMYNNQKLCSWDGHENVVSDGMAAASVSDITVLCLGLDPRIEGETIDKEGIKLPEVQLNLAEKICSVTDNVIVVLMCGSSMDIGDTLKKKAKAILWAGYPGALGGLATAEILSGKSSPSGRLPITFYKADSLIPEIENYSMVGRTYRYFEGTPDYPFGFGLDYDKAEYISAEKISEDDEKIIVRIKLSAKTDMTEKIQIYAKYSDSRTTTPIKQLVCVKSAELKANVEAVVECVIDKYWIKAVLEDGTRVEPDCGFELYYGVPTVSDTACLELVNI